MYPTYSILQPHKSYSLGFETISETIFSSEKSDPSKTSNPNHYEDHSTPPPEIPDLQHYMAALNQQSILTALSNLPVTTKKNMINVLEKLISICGSGHPASMIISHIRWLLKNSQEAQHSFDRKEVDEDETEDNELQVRTLGFNFASPELNENDIVVEKPEPKVQSLIKSASMSRTNKLQRLKNMRNSASKKSSDMQVYTMSV